ncbi:MAG: response regulator [Solirubrobacterales bacterium]|nr:response regulator [Solirubrobacterales bacterium]
MIRVYIADDSLGFGTLAAAWLDGEPDIEVVGQAQTAAEALSGVEAARPDVVVLDRLLPQPEHSEEVLAHVRRVLPQASVVLLSGMPDEDLALAAREIGADGHVSKAVDATALAAAVRRAAGARTGEPGT